MPDERLAGFLSQTSIESYITDELSALF